MKERRLASLVLAGLLVAAAPFTTRTFTSAGVLAAYDDRSESMLTTRSGAATTANARNATLLPSSSSTIAPASSIRTSNRCRPAWAGAHGSDNSVPGPFVNSAIVRSAS